MRILITGGCGFVGSNLAIYLKLAHPDYQIIALDNLKRRGSELNLKRLKHAGVRFLHGDIRNKEDLEQAGTVEMLIEASAEPSVLAGMAGDLDYLIGTNLMGTINCLNYALKKQSGFIFLSTSRVYPVERLNAIRFFEAETRFEIQSEQELPGISKNGISEDFPLDGSRTFYGATKLASELLIQEFNAAFGMKTVINRCGIITGCYQMGKVDQGVVVLWIARHFWKGTLAYYNYGNTGKQVRDILHINDMARLIDRQISEIDKFSGQTFNVGGGAGNSVSLMELTALCEKITGNHLTIEKPMEERPSDVRIYITDNEKITSWSGWRPEKTPEEILNEIYEWIYNNQNELIQILNT
jgi:CDP-paratose 2-epimerase